MSNRTVSVILPTYNRAPLLGRAIESVICQSHPQWELIIVDDGSSDGTGSVLSRYAASLHRRMTVLHQSHAGASTARNAGIDRASGRYVAFLDSDDAFRRDKLARQVALFERRPELGLVFSDMRVHRLDGTVQGSTFEHYTPIVRRIPCDCLGDAQHVCGSDALDYLVRRYCIPTITGMVRRDVLADDVRFEPDQSYSEEWLFFLEVARRAPCGYVDEALSVQYCQANSLSTRSVARNLRQQHQILRRLRQRFPDVSREAKRALRDQMASCCRQMGVDAYKAGRFSKAMQAFARAAWHHLDARTALWTVQSLAGAIRAACLRTRPEEFTVP